MTRGEIKQNKRMKWILFFIFTSIFVLLVAATVMVVFFGIGSPSPKEREFLFHVFIGEVGLSVLALFKVLFGLKKSPVNKEAPVKNVDGKYKYELTCSEKNMVYSGECLVKQQGRALSFNGERQKECNGKKKRRVSYHWFSNWAELCLDDKIRLDYSLSNGNGGIRGYAILEINKKSSNGMTGEFHMLAQEYIFGTVKFKRA